MTKCLSLAASVSNLPRGDSCLSGQQLRPVVAPDRPAGWKRSYAAHAKGHAKEGKHGLGRSRSGASHLALPAATDV